MSLGKIKLTKKLNKGLLIVYAERGKSEVSTMVIVEDFACINN